MDIATLIGILGAFGLVLISMLLGGSVLLFINVPSILIVFLGSIFVVLSKYPLGMFLSAGKIAAKMFVFKSPDLDVLIAKAVEVADVARKGGLLSLEGIEVEHPFMKKGIQLLVDGHDAEVVKNMLNQDMFLSYERHIEGAGIFKALGDVGPAMGMIGTLIGLVQMLSSMDDPASIGPAMAVALLTTLYGALLATLLALPMKDKLELRAEEERRTMSMIIEALLGIQNGQNPRVIEEMLKNYIHTGKRASADDEG